MASSPGSWPGIVAPRLMPAQNLVANAPPPSYSATPLAVARAGTVRPPIRAGWLAQVAAPAAVGTTASTMSAVAAIAVSRATAPRSRRASTVTAGSMYRAG